MKKARNRRGAEKFWVPVGSLTALLGSGLVWWGQRWDTVTPHPGTRGGDTELLIVLGSAHIKHPKVFPSLKKKSSGPSRELQGGLVVAGV